MAFTRMRLLTLFFVITAPRLISGQNFLLPTLYMPLRTLLPTLLPVGPAEQYDRVTSEHVREHEGWSLEEVYAKTLDTLKKEAVTWISVDDGLVPQRDFDTKWFYNISFGALNSSYSSEDFRATLTPSHLQEVLLDVVSQRFLVNLNKVASRLNVPVANLSTSYNPADWEAVVHAVVEESISVYVSRLELGSVESLAKLVKLTVSGLTNLTLPSYEGLVPPLYPMKFALDQNITSIIVQAPGVAVVSQEDIVVTKLVQEATGFMVEDFAILYNFTDEQAKTLARTTFLEVSRMCSVSVAGLMNMTLPSLSRKIVGSKYQDPSCPVLVTVKGKPISDLSNINSNAMSVLALLTASTDLPWREVLEAVNSSLSDWEVLDSVSIQQLANISGMSDAYFLNDSLSVAVEQIYKLYLNGSLADAVQDHHLTILSKLEMFFNTSAFQVANFSGILEEQLRNSSAIKTFKTFLNATVLHFNISMEDVYGPANMTMDELGSLPRTEWNGIIPHIVKAALKREALKLQMSERDLFQFLDILAENTSIAALKELFDTRIKLLILTKEKFEGEVIQTYLTAESIADEDFLNSTVLSVLMAASKLTIADFRSIYGIDDGQLFVLERITFKDLVKYCGINGTSMKGRTPFNITGELVGILTNEASCTTTKFYAGSKSKPVSTLKAGFPVLQNNTAPLLRIIEEITKMSWRHNVWAFGVKTEDWAMFDALSIKTFADVTSKSIAEVEGETLQSIFDSALKLKVDDDAKLRALLDVYRSSVADELYRVFSTNAQELIAVLGITQAEINVYTLPELLQKTLDYYKAKFNVSLPNIAEMINVEEDDLNTLASTEWHEIMQPIKDEIIGSGRTQLSVSLGDFAKLLGQLSADLPKLSLAQLKSLWNDVFVRLRTGKEYVESKTFSHLTESLNVEQGAFWDMLVTGFVKTSLGLEEAELAVLFSFHSDGLDVLKNFTFTDVVTDCGLSKPVINGTTPHELLQSLLGMDSPFKCRAVALAASARMLTVGELLSKFSASLNDSSSFLDVAESVIPLAWPKIAWALGTPLQGWPPLGAVSLNDLASINSDSTPNLKAQKSLWQIALGIGNLTGNSFDNLVTQYRLHLTEKVSELFGVNSTAVCDSCSMSVVDIFDKALAILGAQIDFQKSQLPTKIDLSNYEFGILPPSGWGQVVPFIVADSYESAASSLDVSKDRLAVLFGEPLASVLNATLKDYLSVMVNVIKPLIQAKTDLESKTLDQLAPPRGVLVAGLQGMNILEVISNLTDVPFDNISFVFGWTSENQTLFENYTLAHAAKYHAGGFDALKAMTVVQLVQFINDSVAGEPLPTTPPPTTPPACEAGYTLDGSNRSCVDVDECSSNSCGEDQLCHNYQGGHECECTKPGYSFIETKCAAVKTYEGSLTITNVVYKVEFGDKKTPEFFQLKNGIEQKIATVFEKSSLSASFRGVRVTSFKMGSVIADIHVLMSTDYDGTATDLQKIFGEGLNSTNGKDYLGDYQVTKNKIQIQDYNECDDDHHDCHDQASCINKDGTFECRCNDGFEGDGKTCNAGFLKTMWWTVLIAALVLLIIVIILVILIVKRPKSEQRYGFDPNAENDPRPVTGASKERSRVSYQEGDVFYKDKGGNLRRGTQHGSPQIRETPLGKVNPVFVDGADDVETGNGIRARSPFVPDKSESPRKAAADVLEMNGKKNGPTPLRQPTL